MRFLTIILILGLSFFSAKAQEEVSPKTTVSVVTCGPGNELYSSFGHSAFRVFDPVTGMDKIYNYGTFNFNAPNFYLNFAKGNLIYQLSTTSFNRFLRIYQYENRWVKTQVLNLTEVEVKEMYAFLENNAKPENKNYRYDFFYDNCSTKIESVVTTVLGNKIEFTNDHITTTKTHRDLIDDYAGEFKWGKLGIDIALGAVIDKEATKDDYKFLPDYVYQAFERATIQTENGKEPLVLREFEILKETPIAKPYDWLSPFNVFLVISLFIIVTTYKNYKSKKRSKWLDFLLFQTTGLVGIGVLLLWFATLHTQTYQNMNFLWAFAPNAIVSFFLFKTKLPKWLKFYNLFLVFLLIVLILIWLLKFQVFNAALIPFFIALSIRYMYLSKLANSIKSL